MSGNTSLSNQQSKKSQHLKEIKVVKRSGRVEELDIEKIRKVIKYAAGDFINEEQMALFEMDAHIQFTPKMHTKDIHQILTKTAVDKISASEPYWSYIAARFVLYDLYKSVGRARGYRVRDELNKYKPYNKKSFYNLVKDNLDVYDENLVKVYSEEDFNKLASYIKPERDLQFNYAGIKVLSDRYLMRKNGDIIELPQEMYMLIAMTLALNEDDNKRLDVVKKFYDHISTWKISVATPILMNARRKFRQLSSCFIFTFDDDLTNIYGTIDNIAHVSKYAGGVGCYIGKIRGFSSNLQKYKNASLGVMPVVKLINDTMIYVNQLGIRKGSSSVTLDIFHFDILDFLEVKTNSGEERLIKAHDIHPAVSIPDEFMIRLKENKTWYLFDPNTVRLYLFNEYVEKLKEKFNLKEGENLKIKRIHAKPYTHLITINYSDDISKSSVNFDILPDILKFIEKYFILIDNPKLKKYSGDPSDGEIMFKVTPKGLEDYFSKEFSTLYNYLVDKIESGEITKDQILYEKIDSMYIWKKLLSVAFETGEPYIFFRDTANKYNPNKHCGVVYSSNLCVTGDTLILTQDGYKKVKDLYLDGSPIIAGFDKRTDGDINNTGLDTALCLKMYKTKLNAKVYQLETKAGFSIKATDYHDFYVFEKSDKNKEINIIKKPLSQLKPGDKILIQSGEGFFPQTDNPERDYKLGVVTGFFVGDGSLVNSEKKVHFSFYDYLVSVKDTVYNYLNEILEDDGFISDTDFVKLKTKKRKHKIHINENGIPYCFFTSSKFYKLLENLGFDFSTKYQVPDFVKYGSKEIVIGFLKGLFTADSHLNYQRGNNSISIELKSISKKLLQDVQLLLINLGIFSRIYELEYKRFDGKPDGSRYMGKLVISNINNVKKFSDLIGYLDKKRDIKLKKLVNKIINRKYLKPEFYYSEVKSIKYVGEEDVYDTTQLYNHSLIFNGIVTGNCHEIIQNQSPTHVISEDILDYEKGEGKIKLKLGDTVVCNLISLNMKFFDIEDQEKLNEYLKETLEVGVRILDNAIDLNFYPVLSTEVTNKKYRAIGIGVNNYHYFLVKNNIQWESDEHLDVIDRVFETIAYYGIRASSKLAEERGKYKYFDGSDWSKGIFFGRDVNLIQRESKTGLNWIELYETVKQNGLRNGYLFAQMPTGSTSIIINATASIDPIFDKDYKDENQSGSLKQIPPEVDKYYWHYKSAFHIEPQWIVKAAAVRQKWIDQAQSLNIYITPENIDGPTLSRIYQMVWELGLKTIYYLRSKSAVEICESCSA